jgi:hypothetical protein
MSAPRKRNAGKAPGASVETEQQTSQEPTGDRREVQGIRTKRHPDQRPPTWTPPRGWPAANLLDAYLSSRARKRR